MTTPPDGWLTPAPPQLLRAADTFSDGSHTVADFWTWAFSDLRDNSLRGALAEFIVGTALGATATPRKAWDNYDLLTPDGVKVEVKASGYLQAWPQAKHSQLSFGRVAARTWDEMTNTYSVEAEVRADIFVFCVHTCRDHGLYDVLDLDQWGFYVVGAEKVRRAGVKTIGINWVRERAEAVGLDALPAAVTSAL
jgi:hypothetical protein